MLLNHLINGSCATSDLFQCNHFRSEYHASLHRLLNNPSLLPMTYPTLFPYGIGGPEDDRRPVNISFQ
ncbi:hypothetical protein BDQ17DRAFT_1258656 [Cyathus striatus]|nr:hypothetical protein BDQ17DRAFT_1258656 [Cyathus striatus]